MVDNADTLLEASSKDNTTNTSNVVKKKKTKRTPSSGNRNQGMSASARVNSSRSRDGSNDDAADDHQQHPRRRRRSKSSDRKIRRDSGSQRRDKERSGASSVAMNNASGDLSAGAASATRRKSSPRRVRKSKSDGGEGVRMDDNSGGNHKSRKSRSEGIERKARKGSDHSDITFVRMSGSLSRGFDGNSSDLHGSRSKSPEAPRLPQRTVSGSSTLQSALEATDDRTASKTVDAVKNMNQNGDLEEASLGDFKKYAQQQQQMKSRSRFGASKTLMESRSSKMGDIPEESLGSFTAFAKKYEQERLMGLHDQPDLEYRQQQKADNSAPVAPYNEEQSVSLGGLLSPMKQYGGGAQNKAPTKTPEESLGSFTAFHHKYEKEKLLGLHDSTGSGPLAPISGQTKSSVPEESMGDFVQHTASRDNSKRRGKRKSGGEEKQEEFEFPSSRIEKLGKRSGIGYRIMVDTPGGHSNEPMKIVVAIGFDETDSEDEGNEPQQEPPEKRDTAHSRDDADLHSEIDNSSHLPLSPLEEEKIKRNRELRTRRLQQAMREPSTRKMKNWHTEPDEEAGSEDEDQVRPLGQASSRWKEQSKRFDPGSLKQPKREKSRSNHSTVASLAPSVSSSVSSVTLESALDSVRDRRIIIQSDACPSNPSFQRKPPGYKTKNAAAFGLKRPSGVIKSGGTASLMKLAPHNLGTRRGLLLRQQSQASMKSSKSGVSTDSSWVDPNKDIPEDYEASFMQLNLLDLEKTQMQTNEEVQQAELPEMMLSGLVEMPENQPGQANAINKNELSAIPEGKDPQKAASELLGMKTMLKHIKRVAPKRTKSFDFDKDTPKEMWNSLFARSKKGELPGSEYVDNGEDSTEIIEANEAHARNQGTSEGAIKPEVQTTSAAFAAGLFNAIIGKGAGDASPANASERNSASKGKSSVWTDSAKVTTGVDLASDKVEEHNLNAVASEKGKDDDEASIGIEDFGEPKEEGLENSQGFDNSGVSATGRAQSNRRRSGDKGKESSLRGGRSGRMADHSKKGGTSRSRAARAQHVHNRSLVDTLDYLTAEQDGGEMIGPKNDMDESRKRPTRVRARRKLPNRTRSDDTAGRGPLSRVRSSDGTRGGLGRTKSQETGSPVRPGRDATKRMNQSFSAVDPGVLPGRQKSTTRRESHSVQPTDGPTNEFRDVVKKMQQSFSGAIEPSDLPSRASRAPKSRKGPSGNGKELPPRMKSQDKSQRVPGRKPRNNRRKSTTGPPEEKEPSGHARGIELPKDATEEELRQMLEYD